MDLSSVILLGIVLLAFLYVIIRAGRPSPPGGKKQEGNGGGSGGGSQGTGTSKEEALENFRKTHQRVRDNRSKDLKGEVERMVDEDGKGAADSLKHMSGRNGR
jgi:hypothetical protein